MNIEMRPGGISQDQRVGDAVDIADARAATRAIVGSYNTKISGKVIPEHEQYDLIELFRSEDK